MRILVTGGTGFVGSHLTKHLIADGHEVTVTSTGAEPAIPGVHRVLYMSLEGIDWRWVMDQDVVFHQMANNDTRCNDESEMFRANVYGPNKLFAIAAKGGCKNFVYASSTAVYGAEPAPYIEDVTPVKPLNVYGESKAHFDKYALDFAKEFNVKVTGLRYCNVYGPNEDQKGKRMSMIGQLLRTMRNNQRPRIFTNGEQKRDWIYVKDVVSLNLLAMNRKVGSLAEIYNCGSGVSVNFNEIVRTINEILFGKQQLEPEYIPCPFSDEYQSHTECAIEKARSIGFEPFYNLRSGIEEYLKDLNGAS